MAKADDADSSRTPRVDEDARLPLDFADARVADFFAVMFASLYCKGRFKIEIFGRRERNAVNTQIPLRFTLIPFKSWRRVWHLTYIQ